MFGCTEYDRPQIVLEQKSRLNDVISTGTKLDSVVTKELLGNIFYPKIPIKLRIGVSVIKFYEK